jgi:hypothetical protein
LALAGLPAPASAQAVGSEFQVNTYTTGSQVTGTGASHIAADANGNFVVVWGSIQMDGGDIVGQRFDHTGAAVGAEFRVNSYTTRSQRSPSVAMDASGNFVVVWGGEGQDDDFNGIFGQRFDSSGVPQGTEFHVNTTTADFQIEPSVASDANGNFVVVWECEVYFGGCGLFGQRFDRDGVALGGEFEISPASYHAHSSVAGDASGNFVVVWSAQPAGRGIEEVYGRRYNSEGEPLAGEFRVNSYTTKIQTFPSVTSDASGNFVVVWVSKGQDGSDFGVFGQRYDKEGVAQGEEFLVNSHTAKSQHTPAVASAADGSFLITWRSQLQDGSDDGVFGQRYDGAGAPQAGEFQINSYTPSFQRNPSVAATAADRFVVAWQSLDQDGDHEGVFGKRFDFGVVITVVSPNTNVSWRVGSLQEIRWTHTLGPDATFRVDLDRNGDGSYEEVIAAAAPASSPTKGRSAWTVTGPPSPAVRVRVSWIDDSAVSDASDVPFRIKPGVPLDSDR